jgi:hypothetical protein
VIATRSKRGCRNLVTASKGSVVSMYARDIGPGALASDQPVTRKMGATD